MGNPFDAPPPDYHTELLAKIGQAVLAWNDLDQLLRNLIVLIAARDAISVMILTADMSTSAALNALSALAVEHSAVENSVRNRALADQLQRGLGKKEAQPIVPHMLHLIEYVNLLREFRNFYVHGMRTPNSDEGFLAQSMTARKRLSLFKQPITARDLETLTREIQKCIQYGGTIGEAINHARSYLQDSNQEAAPPTWPEKPPLPDRLVKPRLILLVPRHRGFDRLILGYFKMGRSSGATRSSMLRGTPG
jgi:hypothetical protein